MKFNLLIFISFIIISCSQNQTDLSFLGKEIKTKEFDGNWVLTSTSVFDKDLKFSSFTLPDTVIEYAETFKIKDSKINYELIVNNGWVCGNGLTEFDTIILKHFNKKTYLKLKGYIAYSSTFNYEGIYNIKKLKDTLYLKLDTILKNETKPFFEN